MFSISKKNKKSTILEFIAQKKRDFEHDFSFRAFSRFSMPCIAFILLHRFAYKLIY